MRFSQNDQCMRVKPPTEKRPLWKVCYRSRLWRNHLVHMHRVRVRRCRCCWCRVALWAGYTGSHLPVILSAWHLHLYSSLFVPAVDLLDATSSVRGTELRHVTPICLAVFGAMYNSALLVATFIILPFFTLYNSRPCLSSATVAAASLFMYYISGAECCPHGGTVCDGYLDHTGRVLRTNELLYMTALRCLTFFVWTWIERRGFRLL